MSVDGLLNSTLVQMGMVFAIGAVTAAVFSRFKLPSVLGYIMIGVVLGPSVLNWVTREDIAFLSELGIIFLMFLVGLELCITKIKRLKWQAPLAGVLQLALSGILLSLCLYVLGFPGQLAFLLGSLLSLSSTAIVLKRLEEQRESESLHGRVILAILIIQDIAIVPLMTLVTSLSQPFMAHGGFATIFIPTIIAISKALLVAVATLILCIKLLPRITDRLIQTNKKEVFLLTSIAIVFGASWLSHLLGISYEAGALIAGISLSGSLFSQQMFADTRAYRDVFVMLFFVSMGLWVDIGYIVNHWPMVLLLTSIIILVKALAAYGSVRLAGFHHKNALWSGLALFQVGEFAFVALTQLMKSASAIPAWASYLESGSPLICNAIVITMFITPLVLQIAPILVKKEAELRHERQRALGLNVETDAPEVLLAGYGPVAQRLTRTLKQMQIPYCIIEMNANTIKTLHSLEEPCLFGDVAHPDILQAAGIQQAAFLLLTFPDVRSSEAAIQQAKRLNPNIVVLVRARYELDIASLKALGADHVICEEFESSHDFITTLFRVQKISAGEIQDIIQSSVQA